MEITTAMSIELTAMLENIDPEILASNAQVAQLQTLIKTALDQESITANEYLILLERSVKLHNLCAYHRALS